MLTIPPHCQAVLVKAKYSRLAVYWGIMLFTPQKPIAINENSWRARTVCGSIFPTRRELRERNIFSAVRLSVRFLKNFQAKIHKTWWT